MLNHSCYGTSRGYDAFGHRTARIDPYTNRRTWQYDAADRVISDTDELGRTTAFERRAGVRWGRAGSTLDI